MSAEVVKEAADVSSIIVVIGALAEILPPLAALFTIVWTGIRIYSWCKDRNKYK